ncbi:glycosyltransferase family 2 protein [Listeria booriae]|uniref:glycosyltransferase family 2 protein n=1 Tax=Listeria booriae TaxID=1552123 RepID=UPI001628B234|nr:glycosyltransferase family 2 protein [Listeria booriae]MBC1985365.1 glycosyltransferase family 2 protein [Listeria booriae]MBC2022091.1 glycosyltransferase family 2 protein [Listeria booriae]MBC2025558.1 glycosyltransferase family 2 protein [Listeria booriae]MBC2048012.1 glycosyltransferase family 2 protein [Listeria booriae]MBC2100184.1 glycosyltransferase family 2 protein [Listeria booriae]
MYDKKQVSVIMPCYNAEEVIGKSIESVLAQTYEDLQLIIVDDCSTDQTAAKVLPYLQDERILFIQLPQNAGVAQARNVGMQHSLGRFIAFLDSDDLWMTEKLTRQVELIQKNDAPLVYSAYQTFQETTDKTLKTIQVPETIDYQGLLRNTIIGCLTVLVDRTKTGDFTMPNIPGGEDTATWLHILKENGVAYGINQPLAYYRVSGSSLSGNKWKMAQRTWKMYRETQNLSFVETCVCFSSYVKNAIKKRI